jgi:hypothetical protein
MHRTRVQIRDYTLFPNLRNDHNYGGEVFKIPFRYKLYQS